MGIVDKVAKDMKGIKVKTAWNQSCTWGIFTLLPVLLFALVSLWQMKVSHDNQIKQIKWELDRTVRELEKSVDLHKAAAKELAEERDMTKKINNERNSLKNKTNRLKDKIKIVETKALNLTSKLLLKEVEAGIEKTENIRLMDTINSMKKTVQTKNDLLEQKNENSKLIDDKSKMGELQNESVPISLLKETLEPDLKKIKETSEGVKVKSVDGKNDIVNKILAINKNVLNEQTKSDLLQLDSDNNKLKENISKIKNLENKSVPILIFKQALEETKDSGFSGIKSASEKTENNAGDEKEEIVDKILEIKQKQQELDDAKQELFSDINNTEPSEDSIVAQQEDSGIDTDIKEHNQDKISFPANETILKMTKSGNI